MHIVVSVLKKPARFKSAPAITLSSLCHFTSNLIRVQGQNMPFTHTQTHALARTTASLSVFPALPSSPLRMQFKLGVT